MSPSAPLVCVVGHNLPLIDPACSDYDYNFDYIFSLDGSIETVVRASGYIQSANAAKNQEYGYRIHDALSGSMHDHALTFKVSRDRFCQSRLKCHDLTRLQLL